MEYEIVKIDGFRVFGETKTMTVEESLTGITTFWTEVNNNGAIDKIHELKSGESPVTHGRLIGVFRVTEEDERIIKYTIGAEYIQGSSIYSLQIEEIPPATWMVFHCQGPIPQALSKAYEKIFTEIIPKTDYQIGHKIFLEVYNIADGTKDSYHFEIWIPILKK